MGIEPEKISLTDSDSFHTKTKKQKRLRIRRFYR